MLTAESAITRSGRQLLSLEKIPVGRLEGVGPKKEQALAEIEIHTVLDLLTHYPRRYLDRTQQSSVAEMSVGEEATVLAHVKRVSTRRARAGRVVVDIDLFDGTGYLRCTFFNQPWRSKQLSAGQEVVVFGRLDRYRGRRQMTNPVVDLVGDRTGRIVPIYPQSDKAGLSTWELASWVTEALKRAGRFYDPLPEEIKLRLGLVDRTTAFREIHAPSSPGQERAARKRLVFDELFRLQLALVRRKRALEAAGGGISHELARSRRPFGSRPSSGYRPDLVDRFMSQLPFRLTGSQARAIEEIAADMAKPYPMHRLLQGDVGAGKTVVALAALLVAVHGGYQGALMAPTEVLAEQHFAALRDLLWDLNIPDDSTLSGDRPLRVELLTNQTSASGRDRLHSGLRSGGVDILVGTHALLTEHVSFSSLGIVVIDEQHRFGVEQRATLRAKGAVSDGAAPDLLVMTATPIPRTAAMTVFGDLDATVIDELPAGRTPVRTVWARGPIEEAAAWGRVRGEVAVGRQAYVVCPLVEESERIQARAATEEFERLRRDVLGGLSLGLLHGQMPPREKESVMGDFRNRKVDVLVATTVIEVGVDVTNATVMVIEDAQRFGIAQLHQLRGRVGRAGAQSWCYLLGECSSPEADKRLRAVEATADGFALAEEDLDIRGEGSILGTRQKGRNDLKLASLRRDRDLLSTARQVAFELVDSDPELSAYPLLADEIRMSAGELEEDFLFKS